jgi:hypothetical protein
MPRRSIFEEDHRFATKKYGAGRKGRRTSAMSLDKLRSFVKENGKASWVQGEYRFLFPDGVRRTDNNTGNGNFGSYFWRGREIYVTYAEALYLYERLILGKSGRQCTTNGMLRNLRKRLGDAFLAEHLPAMKQMRRKNRRVSMEARQKKPRDCIDRRGKN